jgi:hypothetical protein
MFLAGAVRFLARKRGAGLPEVTRVVEDGAAGVACGLRKG